MAHGRRADIALVAAVARGDSTALAVSLLGLGALLATSAFWFTVVKWVGGSYLLGPGITQQLWILAITFVVMAALNATPYAVFAGSARRLLASPRAQRRFHLAGGSLLSAAGIWALLAKRPA